MATPDVKFRLAVEGAQAVSTELNRVGKGFAKLDSLAAVAGTTLARVALAGAAAAAALIPMVAGVKNAAIDIERMAAMAGASNDEFQRMAAGAKSVKMDMDKFGDVMKDVQDKVGDFMLTGGGEMKDFFEQIAPKVGVTAEQFKNLSGPQALQLYYTTLEKAGVGQAIMIQQMESLADDASTLAPLLADGGAGFKRLGDEAARAGSLISDDLIAASKALDVELQGIKTVSMGIANTISGAVMPEMVGMARLAKEELAAGFKAVSAWVKDNEEKLVSAWDAAKSLGAEVWGLVSAAIALTVGISQWAVESGTVKIAFEILGALVAGLQDGVVLIGAAFATVGSVILKTVLTPVSLLIAGLGKVQGLLGNTEAAAGLAATADSVKAFAAAGMNYGADIVAQFARGDTAVARFAANIGKSSKAVELASVSTRDALAGLGKGITAQSAAGKKASDEAVKSAAKEVSAYEALKAAIGAKTDEARLELAVGADATEAQKISIKLDRDLANGRLTLTDAHKKSIVTMIAALSVADQQNEAAKESAKAVTAATAAHDTYIDSLDSSMQAVADQVLALQDEAAALVIAADNHISLAQALEAVAIARLHEERARQMSYGDEAAAAALQREIDQRLILAGLIGSKDAQEASKKAGEEQQADFKKSVEQYDDIFRTGFAAMVNGGTDTWKSFTKSLATTFKTTVADQIYKSFAQPFVVKFIASMVGLTGSAAAGAVGNAVGGGSALGGVGNAASIANTGASIAGTASAFGGAFSAGAALGTEAFSAGVTMMTQATGATSFMAGAGQALGAIGPVGWAALAAVAVLSLKSSKVSSYNTGDTSMTSYPGGERLMHTVNGMTEKTVSFVNTMQDSYEGLANSMGIALEQVSLNINTNSGKNAADPMSIIDSNVNGQAYTSLEVSNSNQELIKLVTARALFNALQASDLPKHLAGVFDGMDAGTITQVQIDTLFATAQAFNSLHVQLQSLPFDNLKNMSYATASSLVAAAGGMQALGTSLGAYYDAFYSADEKTALLTKNTTESFAKLGIVMPTLDASTRAWYRREVERLGAMDLGIAANATAYTAVLALSGAVNTLVPAATDASTAVSGTADALAELAEINKGWQDKLDILTGAQTERSIELRDATDDTTRVLMTAVYAQEDYKQSLADTQAAMAAIESERAGLESTLLALQGNTVELRRRELSALDPSNVALQESIYVLQDAKTAQEAYNTALSTAQSRFDSAASALQSAQDAVSSIQNQATSAYLSAQDKVASAQQRIADIQQNALKETEKAAYDAAKNLQDLSKSLYAFASEKSATADQNFATTLQKALAGDTDAMAALPSAATSASDLAAERSSNVALTQARILADVMRVAAIAGAAVLPTSAAGADADPMIEANTALAAAQSEMAESLRVVTAISASTTASVTDLIAQYAQALSAQTAAQIEYAAAQQVLLDIKKNTGDTSTGIESLKNKFTIELALAATTAVTDYLTIEAIALTAAQRDVALAVLDDVTRTIDLVADRIKESERDTALAALVGVSRTVKIVADALTGAQADAALSVLTGVTKTIGTSIKALTGAQRDAAISVLDGVTRAVGLTATNLTGAQASAAMLVLTGVTKTVGTAITALTSAQRDAALSVLNGVTRAVGLTATALTGTQASTALASLNNLSKAVALTVTKFSSADDWIIYNATSAVTKTFNAALGTGNAAAMALANESSETIIKTLLASGGSLTADQRSILNAVAVGNASVTATLGGTLTWDPNAEMLSLFKVIAGSGAVITNAVIAVHNAITASNPTAGGIKWIDPLLSEYQSYKGSQLLKSVSGMFADGGAFNHGVQMFSSGGAFTNQIVSSPTNFAMGQMGEDGPEAIMPLSRDAQGRLGVTAQLTSVNYTGNAGNNNALTAEIRRLRESNERLEQRLAKIEANTAATASHAARTADSTRTMTDNGLLIYTDPAEPLVTKSEAVPA